MTQQDVYTLCRKIAPRYGHDPILILAVCEQESNYDHHARRLEQGFFWRYERNNPIFNDVDEILLSCSYGLMQMMGRSLHEVSYFVNHRTLYDGLIAYLDDPEKQLLTGCEWFLKKKIAAKDDVVKTLSYWNGDQTGKYASEVIGRYDKLKKEL